MTEINDGKICARCQMPKSGSNTGTITQWISICKCADLEQNSKLAADPVVICGNCNKRVEQGRVGSLTQFIFRFDLCGCDKKVPGSPAIEERFDSIASNQSRLIDNQEYDEQPEPVFDLVQFPVERYKPLTELGKGATGKVYLCFDRLLGKKVAVKTLSMTSASQTVSFQNEAKITSQLEHPNIVKVLDFGISERGFPFMVMEYIEGLNLQAHIASAGSLSPETACHLFATACGALQYAHDNKVYHRDLKPSNLLLVRAPDGTLEVKLIDFGIARVKYDLETGSTDGEMAGTPAYMSPEQVLGKAYDARSEIYSLGCVIFEALTGQAPFRSETALAIVLKHVDEQPPLITDLVSDSEIPARIEEIIARCLEKDPDLRYRDMEELRTSLLSVYSTDEIPYESKRSSCEARSKPFVLIFALLFLGIIVCLSQRYFAPPAPVDSRTGEEKRVKITDATALIFLPDSEAAEQRSRIDLKRDPLELNYSGQNLTEQTIRNIGKMRRLKSLVLTESGIEDRWMRHIEHLPLRLLTIGETRLSDAGVDYLADIKTLQVLDLHATHITDKGVALLGSLCDLRSLDVSATGITDTSCGSIIKLKNLQELNVSDTHLSDDGIATLSGLPALVALDLAGTKMNGQRLKSLKKFKSLRQLVLFRCELHDADIIELAALDRLTSLNLARNTGLTDKALEKLKKLSHLSTLNLEGCASLSRPALDNLQKSLPGCRIVLSNQVQRTLPSDLLPLAGGGR